MDSNPHPVRAVKNYTEIKNLKQITKCFGESFRRRCVLAKTHVKLALLLKKDAILRDNLLNLKDEKNELNLITKFGNDLKVGLVVLESRFIN